MGLFDQKQTQLGTNVQSNTAQVTATPWGATEQPWGSLLAKVGGQVNAKTNPYFNQGLGMLSRLANGRDQYLNQAGSTAMNLASGAELGQVNPALQSMLDQNAQRVQGAVGAQASMAGRYGSNAATGQMVQGIADANNPLIAQNFQNNQQRQMQALGMLPGLSQAQYMPAQALMQGGQMQEQGFWDRLRNSGSILGMAGQMGGTKTSTGQTTENSSAFGNKPSSTLQDVAGIGGILGSFYKPATSIGSSLFNAFTS